MALFSQSSCASDGPHTVLYWQSLTKLQACETMPQFLLPFCGILSLFTGYYLSLLLQITLSFSLGITGSIRYSHGLCVIAFLSSSNVRCQMQPRAAESVLLRNTSLTTDWDKKTVKYLSSVQKTEHDQLPWDIEKWRLYSHILSISLIRWFPNSSGWNVTCTHELAPFYIASDVIFWHSSPWSQGQI